MMKKTFLTSILFVAVFVLNTSVYAASYYVSTTGSDSDPGTIDQPWGTFSFAQDQLSAGDTLYLRGGIYFENSTVFMSRKGTAANRITIQAYPGEEATISGSKPYFMTVPNSEWILVDASINLYRSVRTFSGDGSYYPGAWLVDDDISIIQYDDSLNMDSTNYALDGLNAFYNGPGIQLRGSYIYIRLEPNPEDLTDSEGNPVTPVPANYNPNQIPIAVWTHNKLIELTGAEYIHFKDLTFAHAGYVINSYGDYIEIDHCKIKYGSYGVLLRIASHDWYIHDSEFTGGVPEWVRWPDVKVSGNPKEPYPEFQSRAFGSGNSTGTMDNFVFERNLFYNVFDGMNVPSGSQNVIVRHNTFKYSADDALDVFKDISNVEIAYNMFWHVSSGIANRSAGAGTAGPIYIHHNIIDNSHYRRGGRANSADSRWASSPWATLDPFGSHDSGDKSSWWRLYNNTVITRQNGPFSSADAGPGTVYGNNEKYVYNNIFYVRDSRIIFEDDLFFDGSHYDGNVMYQVGATWPLLRNFGDGGDYDYLADFRAANPGSDWEVNGLEIDPLFNFTQIDDLTFDPITLWERYRPTNSQVFTQGASFVSLGWPDTENVQYRGAIPPSGTVDISPPTPNPATFSSAPSADSSSAISMRAITGSDASGPVEYYFDETSGNPGGDDSGWQTSANYIDSGLDADTQYTYTVQMRDSVLNTGITSNPANATTDVQVDDYVANGETIGIGTVSGTYSNTQTSTDSYESITEIESGGKPSKRYSYLEHKWTINVTGGSAATFYVEAYQTSSSDSDNFVFAYSTNDSDYTDMVTVTKTSDDDSYQSYALPGSTSGTVYIRVKDTDQSQGNKNLDTIYVDHMYILSTGVSTPDTDPPTPDPAMFSSAPSADSSSAISMTATTGSDASGLVEYYFDETSGNPGGTDSGWQSSASYTDSGLDVGTQYTYTVQMRDRIPNTGTASSSANATTNAACSESTMYVYNFAVEEISCGGPNKNGQATITIYDNCGNPVSGVNVDGTFSDDFNETINNVTTNTSGVAVFTSTGCERKPEWQFCVDDVTGSLTYNSGDNSETCDGL